MRRWRGRRYAGVDLVTPFGACGRRLCQLLVPAGHGDADQLGVVGRVEREQREDGQAFLLAQGGQPSPRLGRVARWPALAGQAARRRAVGRLARRTEHPGATAAVIAAWRWSAVCMATRPRATTASASSTLTTRWASSGRKRPSSAAAASASCPSCTSWRAWWVSNNVQRPGLAGLLRGTDALGGRRERLVVAVHDGQDLAAEMAGQPLPGILAGVGAGTQGGVDHGQRRLEVAADVAAAWLRPAPG